MTEFEVQMLADNAQIIANQQDTLSMLDTITTHILFFGRFAGITISVLLAMWFVRTFIMSWVRSTIKF